MTFRFSSVLIRFLTFLFIFVSLGLQTTHLSYDKNDVTNILSCDITPIFFSVRTYTRLELLLPRPKPLALISYRKQVALQSVKIEISAIYAEVNVQRCSFCLFKNLQNSQEHNCARVSFLINLQTANRGSAIS